MEAFYSLLRYRFKNTDLLREALTHSSYGNENHIPNNERLEFLGDSVLGFIIANELFKRYPEAQEGDLSKQKSVIVSTPSLARKAREIELGTFLMIGEGERRSGGAEKDSILADAMESILAAMFLDGGMEPVERFVLSLFDPELSHSELNLKEYEDFKTQLQERLQSIGRALPQYQILSEEGPSHNREFVAQVLIEGKPGALGRGKSKKAAQQEAARTLLDKRDFWEALLP